MPTRTDVISRTVEPSVPVDTISTGSASPMFGEVMAEPALSITRADALAVCPGLRGDGCKEITNGCIPAIEGLVSTCRFTMFDENALFPEFLMVTESHISPFACLSRLASSTISVPLSDAVFAVDANTEYPLIPAATATPMRIIEVIAGEIPRLLRSVLAMDVKAC
jgi:hypothetical protein